MLGGLVALALCASAGVRQANEYEVKAAMLMSMTRYVTWPATAYGSSDAPFVVAVIGEDPFGDHLDAAFRGQSVEGHRVVVRRLLWGQSLNGCHLVFLARADSKYAPKLLAATRGKPVLTVSDSDAFAAAGGIIGLRTRSGRIEMEVNLLSAKASETVVSSKLLMLAKTVIDRKGLR